MELKNYLVEILSNIIHDKLQLLSETKKEMNKIDDFIRIEETFSDEANILSVSNEDLKNVLSNITDESTIDGIISNIDMIKIVLNGKNSGLELDLDDSQQALIKGVYDIVNNYRVNLENKNNETKENLEEFISKCRSLSNEIGTGVVRDITTLDSILTDSNIDIKDIVKCKFEILKNNSKNYNLNLEGKVKEEVDLRIAFRNLNIEFDSYSDIEKQIIVNYSDINNINNIIEYINEKNIQLTQRNLFIILLFSEISVISTIYEITEKYNISFNKLFMIPGVFINNNELINKVITENKENADYYVIEYLENIKATHENFIKNIEQISKTRNVQECFNNNILSFIIPDMEKNMTILEELELNDKEFSTIVINPFLATSISSFQEIGLGDYIKSNPLRLTTSYYRLREINARIIDARKNGKIIFRSLSDKKNYWLARSITIGENKESEVK